MLGRLFKGLGYVLSYFYNYRISERIKLCRHYLYTGWQSRRFLQFDGYVDGEIKVVGAKHISVGRGTLIQGGARLLAWDKFGTQTFSPTIKIGCNAMIQKDCFLSSTDRIEIGDNTAVSENTVIIDNVHGDFRAGHFNFTQNEDVPDVFLQNVKTRDLISSGPVVIEEDVHIGMYCMIMPGVRIGHNSVVNAHSVVTRSVPPYSIVSGNPAKVVLTFTEEKE